MEDYKIKIMKLFAQYDRQDELYWYEEDLDFYVLCNDFFWWACADAEDIDSEEDFELLKKSYEDCKKAEDTIGTIYACLLYCSRKRQMRPQGAYYKHIPEPLHILFNEFPERDIDFGNPKNQEGEYKYKPEKNKKEK